MSTHFNFFSTDITEIKLPNKFTYPFYYEPHSLSIIAAKEIQFYLQQQTDFQHNFGLLKSNNSIAIGKMFGVLVVQNSKNQLGYISAVSGKLANKNVHKKFVPPIYDMLFKDSYYLQEKKKLADFDVALDKLITSPKYLALTSEFQYLVAKADNDISEKKDQFFQAKKDRSSQKSLAFCTLSNKDYEDLLIQLNRQSLEAKHFLNNVKRYWKHILTPFQEKVLDYDNQIDLLKYKRKQTSIALQKYISSQYKFINSNKEFKTLVELFKGIPIENLPAGSGECAAPKLLQYAFLNNLKPISMAEFWWGQSPNKEIRKHKVFYPACQGKCKPILSHMLSGIEMDTNPLLKNTAVGKELETIFEDDDIIVICKPPEFLSVPGIYIKDSVYTRIKNQTKNISGPIIIHRLDMSTSGLLVLAKNKKAHKIIQSQFINRTVKKRYTALLDGVLSKSKGSIDLPLRLDLDDRPRQLVCSESGKQALTNWEVVNFKNGNTRIHFFPVSGRTHQLRVHASHMLGLNSPIIGDDLYGKKSDRLYLHSDTLEFTHPTTNKRMSFHKEPDF